MEDQEVPLLGLWELVGEVELLAVADLVQPPSSWDSKWQLELFLERQDRGEEASLAARKPVAAAEVAALSDGEVVELPVVELLEL